MAQFSNGCTYSRPRLPRRSGKNTAAHNALWTSWKKGFCRSVRQPIPNTKRYTKFHAINCGAFMNEVIKQIRSDAGGAPISTFIEKLESREILQVFNPKS